MENEHEENEPQHQPVSIIPPPPVVPQLPIHNLHKIYQFPRTRKTEEMMLSMLRKNKIPSVTIHDPFIDNEELNQMSYCAEDFIDEWIRTSQILLFDQFQESIRNWTAQTKNIKQQLHNLKYERKQKRYLRWRKGIENQATGVDCDKIQKLPDDVIRIIWAYVDYEVKNKYYLGKYVSEENLFRGMLQRLNFQILKKIYKLTAFCYHGLCMQKIIPPERYSNPPINKKTKQDIINEIIKVMVDYCDMYSDVFVYTTGQYGKAASKSNVYNGLFMSKKDGYSIETTNYHGKVYPLEFYEKRTLNLWLHLAVAFTLFLPKDYYSILQHKQSSQPINPQPIKPNISQANIVVSTTPPLPESPIDSTPPESPISFVLI